MGTWTNKDGLTLKYGPDEVVKARVTEIAGGDGTRVIEIVVDSDTLPAFGNSADVDDSYFIPAGVVFTGVEIVPNTTITSSGSATLTVGITDKDGGSNVTNANAFVDAATVAELNAGGKDLSAWVGDGLFVAPLAEAAKLTWAVGTADFTGGSVTIRVSFAIPKTQNDSTLTPAKPYN